MKVIAYNIKEKKELYAFDVLFGLDNLIILSVDDNQIDVNILYHDLMDRTFFEETYENDEKVLKELDLYYKRHLFGRMNEACVLYAILHNFKKEGSDIIFVPEKTELISFVDLDSRYGNIYIWRSIYDFNASK